MWLPPYWSSGDPAGLTPGSCSANPSTTATTFQLALVAAEQLSVRRDLHVVDGEPFGHGSGFGLRISDLSLRAKWPERVRMIVASLDDIPLIADADTTKTRRSLNAADTCS
jgi:hypothetical protein